MRDFSEKICKHTGLTETQEETNKPKSPHLKSTEEE